MNKKILIVEDEPAIADTIIYPLETEKFEPKWCTTCQEAREILKDDAISLIILDVGLPDGNGFEFCKEIRKTLETPIIFLTARKEEIDRILGLEIGGDDYVIKPFSPRELTSRVKAVLRRSKKFNEQKIISPFNINSCSQQITYFGKNLELSRYEYRILKILAEHPGWIYSREKLMNIAWEEPESALDRTVDSHIKSLRQKLKFIKPEIDPIQTHRGMGYSLIKDL